MKKEYRLFQLFTMFKRVFHKLTKTTLNFTDTSSLQYLASSFIHNKVNIISNDLSSQTQQKIQKSQSSQSQQNQKAKIPKALREQVWIKYFGECFSSKCYVNWCSNVISVFNFECGHNIPESKNGKTTIDNLRPICSRCNKSMGNQYTINEWQLFTK